MAEEDQCKQLLLHLLAFMNLKRMPFGYQGAPTMFQHMMDKLLEGRRTFSNAYIDDVIMFSRTWEEHIHHLNIIFERLQRAGLITEKKKFYFGAQHVKYLM